MSDTAGVDTRRHILILSHVFPPDNVSTAHQVEYMASDLTAMGSRVTVVTTRPHSRPEVSSSQEGPTWNSDIRVMRVPVLKKGRSHLKNALIWLTFLVGGLFCALFRARDVDVVLSVTPPPGIGFIGLLTARRHRARLVYNVKELYPDVLVALGLFDSKLLVRFMRGVEDVSFRRADAIATVTEGQARAITARAPDVPCWTIPDCVDTDVMAPSTGGDAFRSEWGLKGSLVVTYAGNIGIPQDLDLLLDASALLTDVEDLRIVVVGDGTERQRLVARVEAEGLRNVVMIPNQPFSKVPAIYAASDVLYVPLAETLGAEAMPSKAYQALAAERPIIGAASPESAVTALVRSSRAGFEVESLTPGGVASAIRRAAGSREALGDMGVRGREWVVRRYSRTAISSTYSELFDSILRSA